VFEPHVLVDFQDGAEDGGTDFLDAIEADDLTAALGGMKSTLASSPLLDELNSFSGSVAAEMQQSAILAMLASLLFDRHFEITHIEMLKGMAEVGYTDRHRVPIIENTPREHQLEQAITQAIADAPEHTHAVLVRRHGVYVWGDTWLAAKRHAECYDYLFQAAVEMHRLGIDPTAPPG